MYAHMNGNRRMPSTEQALSDGDLMRQVAEGSAEALGLLHRRFARLIFGLAVQSLDRAAAEDLVQEVFLAVWRNARRFDPERGTVRAWVLQITHYRLLNELRHRNRQPDIVPDPEGLVLADLPANDPGPAEATWEQHRRAVLKSALDELPPSQREALSLAFLEDLTHEQVAAELGLPLGTAKTRIRAGLLKLRSTLGPQWAALVAVCLLAALGIRYRSEHATLARYDRALSLVTASDSVNLRLGPMPGTAEATHARYRGRPAVTRTPSANDGVNHGDRPLVGVHHAEVVPFRQSPGQVHELDDGLVAVRLVDADAILRDVLVGLREIDEVGGHRRRRAAE